jgi:hypothetical protein
MPFMPGLRALSGKSSTLPALGGKFVFGSSPPGEAAIEETAREQQRRKEDRNERERESALGSMELPSD